MKRCLLILGSCAMLLSSCEAPQKAQPSTLLEAVEQQGQMFYAMDRARYFATAEYRRAHGDSLPPGSVLSVLRGEDAKVLFLTPKGDGALQTTVYPLDSAFYSGTYEGHQQPPHIKFEHHSPVTLTPHEDSLARMYRMADSLSHALQTMEGVNHRYLAFIHPVHGMKILLYVDLDQPGSIVWGDDFDITLHELQRPYQITKLHSFQYTRLDTANHTRHVHNADMPLHPIDYFLLRKYQPLGRSMRHIIAIKDSLSGWEVDMPGMRITPVAVTP